MVVKGKHKGFVPRAKKVVGEHEAKQPAESTQSIVEAENKQDDEFGYTLLNGGQDKTGWLLNFNQTSVFDPETRVERSAVNFYFVGEDGDEFRATVVVPPYFLIRVKEERRMEIEQYLLKRFEGVILSIELKRMEDLDLPNHLSGIQALFLKLSFSNGQQLMTVRKFLHPFAARNRKYVGNAEAFSWDEEDRERKSKLSKIECLNALLDMREFDVPYTQAVCIAKGYRAGLWYDVAIREGDTVLTHKPELVEIPDLRVLAYDIETTKSPLKFPDPSVDSVMMISYMVDGEGFLIVNRQIVSEDIDNFEYTPKPEFPGPFFVFNEVDEKSLLERFMTHLQEIRPHVVTTYNGDFFDFKFLDARIAHYGLSMQRRIGIGLKNSGDEYAGRFVVHLDAFCWVRRDSYLPQGSQGLKAVTKAKLSYNPIEIDPEEMLPFARSRPQLLASYSVSDAVATYYLYMKYVHLFVYSLCTIIPMGPADVLRKGSGTLCEQLLMVEAARANIVCPNKDKMELIQFHEGHLLESQTYIGGHVECLKSGVFRANIPEKFAIDKTQIQELIDSAADALRFAVETEWQRSMDEVTNADVIISEIVSKLSCFLENPKLDAEPLIYHLDVQAMYPNLILTNRLQPMAIVNGKICAACDYNVESEICQRHMEWAWKGRYYPAKRSEFEHMRETLQQRMYPGPDGSLSLSFSDLPYPKQAEMLAARVKQYSNKVYKKSFEDKVEIRSATICQRENPFYVDTVRSFRDRRYLYKAKNKEWKDNLKNAKTLVDKQKANSMVLLYDSMQLAHKCILNSFYGYVMRKGARWHSMEMAGVVTVTGANIIKMARELIEKIGLPLELDTDGIWCILPKMFPENFTAIAVDNNNVTHKFTFSYPCTILNRVIHKHFTNDQYLTLKQESKSFARSTENTIFFEVDGPYRAMVIPAAPAEGKTLKKRYAVFNTDGSFAELKGFEIKRRGELSLIKVFQSQVFPAFLHGATLKECYEAVGAIANRWLDVLDRKGADLSDEEVFELLSETKSMSQSLSAYATQRSTAITTAKRLAEFLGSGLLKDKISCRFIISKSPQGAPVSDRAVPVAIFSANPVESKKYLRKWLGDSGLQDFDIRSILDWSYYTTRLGSAIMKIITIPAALQGVENPCSRVEHPEWLKTRVATELSSFKQTSISRFFSVKPVENTLDADIEDTIVAERTPVSETVSRSDNQTVAIISHENAPNMRQDFASWLSYEKKRWQSLRKRKVAQCNNIEEKIKHKKLQRIVESKSRSVIMQVVQYKQCGESDDSVVVWVYLPEHSEMRQFSMHVPRTVYINSLVELADLRQVRRTLPRSRPIHFLYEATSVTREEIEDFRRQSFVDAVYESDISPVFRAVMQLGNMVRIQKRDDLWRKGCSISELEFVDGTQSRYCPGMGDAGIRKIFIYATGHPDRAVLGAFVPDSESIHAFVFIVSTRGNPTERPELASFVDALSAKLGIDTSCTIHTKLTVVKTINKGAEDLKKKLLAFCKSHRENLLLITQISSVLLPSIGDLTQFGHRSSFPVVEIPPNLADDRFETLQWVTSCCRIMTARFLCMERVLADYLACSSYSLIPIGNMGSRSASLIIDVFFARLLKQHDHILWCSPSHCPDLGSKRPSQCDSLYDETLVNPERISPGSYRGICIEFEMCNMAANALLINEMVSIAEGTLSARYDAVEEAPKPRFRFRPKPSDCLESSSAFAILSQLACTLFDEVRLNHNAVADMVISNIYKWISSAMSLLYEPHLHRLLHGLMEKVFNRLCSEFKSLGSQIVLGTFNKMVICTKRHDVQTALSFLKYASKCINEQEMFRNISFKFDRLWLTMLYMDPANYTGIPWKPDEDDLSRCPVEEDIVAEGEWNISEFLPEIPRAHFIELITEFVIRPYLHWRDISEAETRANERANAESLREKFNDYLRSQVSTHYMRRILEMVDEINVIGHGAMHSDEDRERALAFPSNIRGKHLPFVSSPLEFVKMCTHVLSLESSVHSEVESVRSAAFQLLGVSAFSPAATFKNPCSTYIVPDVTCLYCDTVRDVDMCREPLNNHGQLQCSICMNPLDMRLIETGLVKYVARQSDMYQIQDSVCAKCCRTVSTNMSSTCPCSGELQLRQTPEDWAAKISIFSRIGKYFGLEYLQAICDKLS